MATHIDVKGVIHYVQAGYATGDIAILSDCKHAWRVKKTVLAAARCVAIAMMRVRVEAS